MTWPQILEFRNAIRNTKNLQHAQLARGLVEKDKFDQPKPWSGGMAVVYKIRVGVHNWAIRTFQGETDHLKAYEKLSAYFKSVEQSHPVRAYFAPFYYIQKGLRLPMYPNDPRNPYPIVVMRWIDGKSLDTWVKDNRGQPRALLEMATKWLAMVSALHSVDIAHNDLQQGNVLVTPNGDLKLIDYDGMFVPSMRGERARELGHPNWRHPRRQSGDFAPYLDQFPGYLGYVSLLTLAQRSHLFDKHYNGQNLIFTAMDLCNPGSSSLCRELNKLDQPVNGVKPVSVMLQDLVQWTKNPVNWKTIGQLLLNTPPVNVQSPVRKVIPSCSNCGAKPANHFVNNRRVCFNCYRSSANSVQPPSGRLHRNSNPVSQALRGHQPTPKTGKRFPPDFPPLLITSSYGIPVRDLSVASARQRGLVMFGDRWVTTSEKKELRRQWWTLFFIRAMALCVALFGILSFIMIWAMLQSWVGFVGGLIIGGGQLLIGSRFDQFSKWAYGPAVILFSLWVLLLGIGLIAANPLIGGLFWVFGAILCWRVLNKEGQKIFCRKT